MTHGATPSWSAAPTTRSNGRASAWMRASITTGRPACCMSPTVCGTTRKTCSSSTDARVNDHVGILHTAGGRRRLRELQCMLQAIAPPEQLGADNEGWCSKDPEPLCSFRLLAEARLPLGRLGLSHDVSTRETLAVEKVHEHFGSVDIAVIPEVRAEHVPHERRAPLGVGSYDGDPRRPHCVSREDGRPFER